MAKKSTSVNTKVIAALKEIATTGRTAKEVGQPLLAQGLIEVNTADVDANGLAAARLTDAGQAAIAAVPAPVVAGEATSAFAIITNAVLPASKRGNRLGSGAPAKYPFATMEVGNSFFVPATADTPNPLKTLGSTVAVQNHRYSEPTGEVKKVERTKRGEKNRAVLDANGNKVREVVDKNLRKPIRKFSIRGVEKGVEYGGWTAPSAGALIARVL